MNYRIGDKVRFLNESGGGTVTSLPSLGTVGVTTDDGFELPIHVSQLVLVSRGKEIAEEEEVEKYGLSETIFDKLVKDDGIYLGFATEGNNPMIADVEIYLINRTNYLLKYIISAKEGLKQKYIDAGEANINSEEYIDTITGKDAGIYEHVLIQVLFYHKNNFPARQPLFKSLNINTVRLQAPEYYKEEKGLKIQVVSVAEPPRAEQHK